ncbi:hypothetical protein C8J56DRAFT_891222 [Mycena floridula]|nr:hypothetical protein C8J56DRAFT_1130059 [Mycena floridula]KAJ7586292.1 hypothetical protein C8J56DRAFT_891222 [Mycena floridula]
MVRRESTQLGNSNWDSYSIRHLAAAGPKGFEPFLLGLTTRPPAVPIAAQRKWDVKAAAAAADLIESLGDDQIAHIKDIRTDPRGMWQRLELFHTSGRAANDKLSTWKQFFSIQYTDYSVELKDHIGGLIEITGRLADFEAPLELSPSMVIARILSSLPRPEFSDIIKRLDTDSRNAERDYVIGRLLKEEGDLRRDGFLQTHDHSTRALAVMTPEQRLSMQCSNCKKFGHLLESCFQPGGPIKTIPDWYIQMGLNRRNDLLSQNGPQGPQAHLAMVDSGFVQTIAM